MAKVRDLLKGSLRLIGAIDPGEDISAAEAQDALSSLNGLLQSWSIQNLLIFETVREEFTLIPSQGSYTMGPSGEFNTARPIRIQNAATLDAGSETQVKVLNQQQWTGLGQKDLQSSLPTKLFTLGTSPLETVKLWPVPTEASTLVLYSVKPLTAFTSINQDVELPEGYYPALRFNLAIELAPEYGKSPDALVISKAQEYLGNVKRINTQSMLMVSDIHSGKRFNILTGE